MQLAHITARPFSVTRRFIAIHALGIFFVLASFSGNTHAQAVAAERALVMADGPRVTPLLRANLDAALSRSGYQVVPAGEVQAVLQFAPSGAADPLGAEAIEKLRLGLNAAVAASVLIKSTGAGNFAIRVIVTSASGPQSKFGASNAAGLDAEASRVLGELIEGLRATESFPTIAPAAAPAPVAVAPVPAPATVGDAAAVPVAPDPVDGSEDPADFKKGKITYGASGFGGLPTGDIGDFLSFGIGALATGNYEMTPNIQITARVGYIYYLTDSPDEDIEFSVSAIPLWAGARYYLKPDRKSYFVHAELGFTRWSFETTFDAGGMSMSSSSSDVEISYNLSGGKNFGALTAEAGIYISDTEGGSAKIIGATVGKNF